MVRIFIFLALCLMCVLQARAACSIKNGALINSFIYLNFPDLVIQKDVPVGSVLAKVDADITSHANAIGVPAVTDFISCTSGSLRVAETSYGKVNYNGVQMLDTSIPGVAIRVTHYGGTGKLPWSFPPGNTFNFTGNVSPQDYGGVTFELIKTAMVTGSGKIPSGYLMRFSSFNQYYLFNYRLTSSNITTVSCTVMTPAIDVTFGDVEKREFNGIGSAAAEKEFQLKTDCDSGARINVSLNGDINPDANDPAILSLQNYGDDSVADGVGIQILQNSLPVKLNQQFFLKDSAGGVESFSFKARYYQTKGVVTSGKANAVLTFSVTYN